MSVSTRILLFAALGICVTCLLGASLLRVAWSGQGIRERVIASYDQFDSFDRLEDSVWPYLNALARARQAGKDIAPAQREQEALLEEEWAKYPGRPRQRGGGPGVEPPVGPAPGARAAP